MHEDFEYVESLEKEIDELESEKADFSNIYDLLLKECVSKDVICSYLHSLSDLNAHTGLQCLYLHKFMPVIHQMTSDHDRSDSEFTTTAYVTVMFKAGSKSCSSSS
ncbi:hypothetical protein Tco_0873768 [Tanacetum coccineum]|uniref:Uncharacterized protein n=1 Tax=Tanacetum coccineum TaxID=301880 RepID=A0ABQ5BML6_9ASTR